MKTFIFKRKVWKRVGIFFLFFILSIVVLVTIFWYTYVYISTPKETVQFVSKGETIVGTLYYPNNGEGPFPTVLVLPGSGPSIRNSLPLTVQSKGFIKSGFAVLVYDKRGSGESGGIFRNEDFENLILDINNALDFLTSKPKVRPDDFGLATNSESVFFGPQIASERDDIAFIYATVGSLVDFASLSIFQMRHRMNSLHDTPDDVDEIITLHKDILDFYMQSDQNPSYFNREKGVLQQRMSEACAKYGAKKLPFGCQFGAYNTSYVRRRAYSSAYDPRIYFEKSFETKLFYSFAALDINVPTEASVAALKKIMERNMHDTEYKIWPNIDHDFGEIYWAPYGIYPKGYLDEMGAWAQNVINEKE